MEGPRGPRDIRPLVGDELGLGRMARNLPRHLQHHHPYFPRRANISTIQDSDLALVKNASSLSRAIGSRHNSRLLRVSLRCRVLAIAGCIAAVVALGWLAKHVPNISPTQRNLKVSWKILVPLGFSVPTIFFFLFTSALIPIAAATMIVGAILVLGYERLLTRWASRGFSDLQKLGLMTGALGFFAALFDFILESLGRLGTSALGVAFVIYLLWIRKKIIVQLPGKPPPFQLGPEIQRPEHGIT